MLFKKIFIGLIRIYQWTLRPFVGHNCRFYPTCSDYGIEAIQKHGALKGVWLICKRLVRCHPFCQGGCDPVP